MTANATSTVALWPGTVGSMVGYLDELKGARDWAIRFAVPSLAGGLVGALLLLLTPPDRFDDIVPWLVLGATALFVIQRPIMRRVQARASAASTRNLARNLARNLVSDPISGSISGSSPSTVEMESDPSGLIALKSDPTTRNPPAKLLLFQFVVAIYGGYFGAGLGILMLAALGFMGFSNIHRMNGLKNWGGLCANLVAAVTFAMSGIVDWPVALAMAIGALGGGYGGSRLAQRVRQERVRQLIILIGFSSGLWLLFDRLTRNS